MRRFAQLRADELDLTSVHHAATVLLLVAF
jgi:hypothetical protein